MTEEELTARLNELVIKLGKISAVEKATKQEIQLIYSQLEQIEKHSRHGKRDHNNKETGV